MDDALFKIELPYPLEEKPVITTEEGSFYVDHSFDILLEELEYAYYVAILIRNGVRRYWGVYNGVNEEKYKTENRKDVIRYLQMCIDIKE